MLCLSGHAVGQTVYLDTFDNDGVDVNANVGGGGTVVNYNGAGGTDWGWDDVVETTDNPGLYAGIAASGNRISTFDSNTAFLVSDGFTLEVQFDMLYNDNNGSNTVAPFNANHLSFGLVAVSGVSNLFSDNTEVPYSDGIGFSLGTRNSNVDMGLLEYDFDGGVTSTLSPFDFTGNTVTQTVTLTVASDGSYTYSYDDGSGGAAITGTGTTIIDLSQPYYFKARTQASSGNAIQSVMLTTSTAQFAAPTITASESLIVSGNSVDLNITFDASAESASLTTPAGSTDLLAIDASDAVPNDGMVVVTDSPTSNFTYVVEAGKTGVTTLSASVDVLVVGAEAADNDFSIAMKADSPLFYYRFEEAADSGYLTDSSGNGYHTTNISGDLIQGGGAVPGGMDLAGEMDDVRIEIPATSEHSESFTLTAVLNSNNIQAASKNLFAMTNGTGIGRSVVYLTNGHFESFLDGSVTEIPVATMPDSQTSFLLHCVYDADPDGDTETEDQEMSIYIDGVFQGSATLGTVAANEGNWVLASNKNNFQFFDGWFDEAAVFETALTDVQIAAHATAFFTAADPFLGFSSDLAEVATGDPVTLTWKISDLATAVTINGVAQDISSGGGVYTTTFNPTEDTSYEIIVSGPGGPFTETVDVTVTAPLTAPTITSITTNGVSPDPQVTIEIQGTPNSVFEITYSADLVSGWEYLDTISTDETGYGTKTFPGEGTREFYRVEVP